MASVTAQKMKSIDAIVDQLVSTDVYPRPNAANIKAQCKMVVQNLLHLSPLQGTFTTNTGETLTLMKLEGVIPTEYQGVTYQTPIVLWVPKDFPSSAPTIYVTPTQDMMVQHGHPHVDMSGLVFVPYMDSWSATESSLVYLIMELCSLFSQHPPLRARPRNMPAPSPMGLLPSHSAGMSASFNPFGATGQSTFVSAAAGAGAGTASYTPSPPALVSPSPAAFPPSTPAASVLSRQRSIEDSEAKQQLKQRVNRLLQTEMQQTLEHLAAEIDKESDLAAGLQSSKTQLDSAKASLQAHAASMQQYATELNSYKEELQEWLRVAESSELTVDAAKNLVAPGDTLSLQLLQTVAEAAAIEDLYDVLTKALENGTIGVEEYLKEVRKRAKRQFELKALAKKIHGAQAAQYSTSPPQLQAAAQFVSDSARHYPPASGPQQHTGRSAPAPSRAASQPSQFVYHAGTPLGGVPGVGNNGNFTQQPTRSDAMAAARPSPSGGYPFLR